MSMFVQFSLRCSPEDTDKSFHDVYCPGKGGNGRDEGKATDLSAERQILLSERRESWRSFLVYGHTKQNQVLGELNENCLFSLLVLVAEQQGIASCAGFLSIVEKQRKTLDYIHEDWIIMTFQVGYNPHILQEKM